MISMIFDLIYFCTYPMLLYSIEREKLPITTMFIEFGMHRVVDPIDGYLGLIKGINSILYSDCLFIS